MATRSRRAIKAVNYRRLNLFGVEDDSSDEDVPVDDTFHDDQEEIDEILSGSSSEEEEDQNSVPDDVFKSSDGTLWTTRIPRAPTDAWRYGLIDHHDGPKNEANVPDNLDLMKMDIFMMMFSDDITVEICQWTNKWAHNSIKEWNKDHPNQKPKLWRDTNKVEMRGFLGLLLLGGIEKPRKKPWSEMWSTDERIRHPAFSAAMSRDRFLNLMNAIRFDDALERRKREQQATNPKPTEEKFLPIQKVFQDITAKFSQLYTPGAKICVDEQIIRFRGNCPFRVYMPQKPGKYGIKLWALVDNASGYIIMLKPYLGKVGEHPEVGLARKVVLDLVSEYKDSCRGVVADNFFTSIGLVKDLIDLKLTYCGTIRKNKIEVPAFIKGCSNNERENVFLFNEDHLLTLVRHNPKKNKFVLLLSSAHYDNDTILVRHHKGDFNLPVIIDYYNANKGGVDTADQMLQNYTSQYPTKRWPMKVIVHLLDCVALNAFIIWMKNNPLWNNSHRSSRRKFIRELAFEMIMPQVRLRAATVTKLQGYVRSAMKIMGVDHSPSDTKTTTEAVPSTSKAGTTPIKKQGRCQFDKGIIRNRKTSRRFCLNCHAWICEEHRVLICPECAKKFAETQTAATEVSLE